MCLHSLYIIPGQPRTQQLDANSPSGATKQGGPPEAHPYMHVGQFHAFYFLDKARYLVTPNQPPSPPACAVWFK
jgi:hypothetical protein